MSFFTGFIALLSACEGTERVVTVIISIRRVSTSYGRDSMPPAAQRVQFCPRRKPGVDLGMARRSSASRFLRALDFFLLFFSTELVTAMCENTNKYAWAHILEKPTYSERDGSWKNVSPDEMMKFIGLLIYMGIVQLPRLHLYWSTAELFSGLIPRGVMPRKRFFSFLGMLSVTDHEATNPATDGKLHRIAFLLRHINDVSALHFQPDRYISVDERMVKSKGRSGIRQYLRDKIVKWGYKLWVLADSNSGYTVQFSVYTGKRETPSVNGLAFDVVTSLCEMYFDQGYTLFMDNFYTSTSLFLYLLERKTCLWNDTEGSSHVPCGIEGLHMGEKGQEGRCSLAAASRRPVSSMEGQTRGAHDEHCPYCEQPCDCNKKTKGRWPMEEGPN